MTNSEFLEIKSEITLLQNKVDALVNLASRPLITKSKTDEEIDDLIDVSETAKITRYSESTVYTKASKGQLPCEKKDGRLHFSKKRILEWIKSGKPKNPEELPNDRMINMRKRYRK